jgi:receptor protein-tyrosine kinase
MKIVVGQGETLFAPGLSVNVQPFTQTITDLLESQVVARRTISDLGLNISPTTLLSRLSVSTKPDTSVLNVSYNDTNRPRAVSVLATLGAVFTGMVNNALGGKASTTTAPGQTASQPVSAVIFDPAHADPGTVSPRTTRTLILAAALGLIAGLMLAFLRDALSSRIRSEDEAEAAYGAPVVGRLPRGALGMSPHQLAALPPRLGGNMIESFQLLTARLRYSTGLQRGVIVVTGALPEDGKTTVAAHISNVLAAAGNDLIVVEADLHRPAMHRLMGVEPGRSGMRDVVDRDDALLTTLVEVQTQNATPAWRGARRAAAVGAATTEEDGAEMPAADGIIEPEQRLGRGGGRLRLLPAGVADENPLTVLSLGNSSPLVARLRAASDYVVFDTPPLLLSGDAYPLVQLADAVVVVCREQVTLRSEARRARDILRSLGVSEFSLVVSESAAAGRRSGYYGYREDD